MLYACDLKWWDWHKGAAEFKGRKITQDKGAAEKYPVEYIESLAEDGLSTDPDIIHQGCNSGYQAINLAYHFGAKRIILLGYDMQFTRGESHWFGDHPDGIKSSYGDWIGKYNTLARHAHNLELEVINCTRITALTCFPRESLESAL